MDASHKKVEHHLKKALEEIRPSKSRSRSGSPVRAAPKERKPRKKAEPKESVAHEVKEKAPRKVREPKEKPAKIHVCREKKTGLYKKCATPKK
jgi:hypothetical protein